MRSSAPPGKGAAQLKCQMTFKLGSGLAGVSSGSTSSESGSGGDVTSVISQLYAGAVSSDRRDRRGRRLTLLAAAAGQPLALWMHDDLLRNDGGAANRRRRQHGAQRPASREGRGALSETPRTGGSPMSRYLE
jgi:hypothetical protein